jgi:hypothetical protein
MAKSLKHVGKIKNTGSKVLVVFRTLPGESNMALVLPTATLPDIYHNSIMELVETDMAQQSNELGEILFVRSFPDGRNMLQAMQADNRLQKVATDNVIMSPTVNSNTPLDQLNILIAEQRNCTVDDLCTFVKGATPVNKDAEVTEVASVTKSTDAPLQAAGNQVLSDTDIAKSYRSQADALYKEAALLRKQADELDPPKKKSTAKDKEVVDA